MSNKTLITAEGDTQIRMERVFNAPRQLVWDCYSDPALMPEWLGPRGYEMKVVQYDLRVGGRYRYTHQDQEGNVYAFYGEILELAPPEVWVQTFNFEGQPGEGCVDRTVFEDLGDGRTRVVTTSTFKERESRDGMIASGMEKGVVDSYERLDDLLARKQA